MQATPRSLTPHPAFAKASESAIDRRLQEGRRASRLDGRGRCAETDGSYAASRLCVFGRGLRFALRFFSACNPRPSNLHQYRFVLFRCSLRQTVAFCRVLPEEVSVTVHDTFHLFGCSNVPSCKPGTLRTVPVEMNFAAGTKAAIRRLSRALMGRNGERRNGKA
jgi:hypothetical protein